MKSSTESLSPTRVKLTIEVPFEEFKPNLDKAYKTIGAQIQIPGFRKGKVPPPVIDRQVGRGAVLDQAINEALPQPRSKEVVTLIQEQLGKIGIDVELQPNEQADHIAKLEQLRELGVTQFAGYLQHDNKEETLRVYGETVIHALSTHVTAKA